MNKYLVIFSQIEAQLAVSEQSGSTNSFGGFANLIISKFTLRYLKGDKIP